MLCFTSRSTSAKPDCFFYLTGLFIFSDVAAILRSGDQLRHQQMFISASRSAGTLCEVHRDFSKGLPTFLSREKC